MAAEIEPLTGQGQRCFGGRVRAACRGTDTIMSSTAMSLFAARPRTPSKAAGCSLGNSMPVGGSRDVGPGERGDSKRERGGG